VFHLRSASGNTFAYAMGTLPLGADGPRWARRICPGNGLDGLFLVGRPMPGQPWVMEHWDADGASTFCSNGTRAALDLPGAPRGPRIQVVSNLEAVTLQKDGEEVGILMPSGPGTGFRPLPPALQGSAAAYGWVGNPQLVLERTGVEGLDLAALAPPLRRHPALEGGANVNFVEVLEPGVARIRSWERGVEGETACCGTGCAVAGAWLARKTGIRAWKLLPQGDPVTVTAELEGEGWKELWLSGPVRSLGTLETP
jgi:diaminopimelate epimerase